jgi:hypothetical protein
MLATYFINIYSVCFLYGEVFNEIQGRWAYVCNSTSVHHTTCFRLSVIDNSNMTSMWTSEVAVTGPSCNLWPWTHHISVNISMSGVDAQGDPCTATIFWYIVRPLYFIPPVVPYLWQSTVSYITESHYSRLVPYKRLPKRRNFNSAKAFAILFPADFLCPY